MIPVDHWICTTPFVVFDVESTGIDPERDRIVQLAMIQIDGGEVVDEMVTLVEPGVEIPESASAIHGITAESLRLADAQPFAVIAEDVARRARGRIAVGYNATKFDAPIIRAELARCGIRTAGRQPLDPLMWIRKIDRYAPGKGRHRLEEAARRRGITWEGSAHDALTDCRITWALMRHLVDSHPREFWGDLASVLDRQAKIAAMHNDRFETWRAAQPIPGAALAEIDAEDRARGGD